MLSSNPNAIVIKWVSKGHDAVMRGARGMSKEMDRLRKSALGAVRATGSPFTRSLDVLRGKFNNLRQSISRTRNSLSGFTGIIGLAAVASATHQVIRYADSYVSLKNQLALVTIEHEKQLLLMKQLMEMSKRTRADMEGTVSLFSKAALGMEPMGYNLREILTFTEDLNRAVAVSGATADEAKNALLQLSQGLSLGVLRGQDLRSVMSQLPYLAAKIAEGAGFKGGVADMIRMGEQGKLTSELIINAMRKVRKSVQRDFESLGMSFTHVMVEMRTSALEFFGTIEKKTGIVSQLSSALLTVINNLDRLIAIVFPALLAGVVAVTGAITRFAKRNWLVLLASAASLAVNEIIKLAGGFDTILDRLKALSAATNAFFTTTGFLPDRFKNAFDEYKSALANIRKEREDHDKKIREQAERMNQWLRADMEKRFREQAAPLRGPLVDVKFFKGREDFKRQMEEGEWKPPGPIRVGELSDLWKGRLSESNQQIDTIATSMSKLVSDIESEKAFKGLLGSLERENELLKLNATQRRIREEALRIEDGLSRQLTSAELGRVSTLVRKNEQLEIERGILDEIRGPQIERERVMRGLNKLYEEGTISIAEYTAQLKKMGEVSEGTTKRGFKDSLSEAIERTKSMGAYFGDLLFGVGGALDKLTNRIVEFVKTGTFSLRSFFTEIASTVLSTMLKLLTLQALSSTLGIPLGGGFGQAATGVATSAAVARAAAPAAATSSALPFVPLGIGALLGGAAMMSMGSREGSGSAIHEGRNNSLLQSGSSILRGEAGPGQAAGRGGDVRIVNVIDPKETLAAISTSDGEKSILNVIGRNRSTVKNLIGS